MPTIELDDTPRMADFARWGCAIAEATGFTKEKFLSACRRNIALQTDWAIEASPVAQAVVALMEGQQKWEGTASDLLFDLDSRAEALGIKESRYWPREYVHMGRKLNDAQATLSKVGIHIEHIKTSKGRQIIITRGYDSRNRRFGTSEISVLYTSISTEKVSEETLKSFLVAGAGLEPATSWL